MAATAALSGVVNRDAGFGAASLLRAGGGRVHRVDTGRASGHDRNRVAVTVIGQRIRVRMRCELRGRQRVAFKTTDGAQCCRAIAKIGRGKTRCSAAAHIVLTRNDSSSQIGNVKGRAAVSRSVCGREEPKQNAVRRPRNRLPDIKANAAFGAVVPQ